jgi:hypothetical protein
MKFSDLTEEQVHKICEAFAERELIEDVVFLNDKKTVAGFIDFIETRRRYFESKDDMGRIIEGMDRKTKWRYIENLCGITTGMLINKSHAEVLMNAVSSDCEQQFIAAAMALGILKEELV